MKLEKLALLALCLSIPTLMWSLLNQEVSTAPGSLLLPEQELMASAPAGKSESGELPTVGEFQSVPGLKISRPSESMVEPSQGRASSTAPERLDAAELGYMQGRVLLEGLPAAGVIVELLCSFGTKHPAGSERRAILNDPNDRPEGWEPAHIPLLEEELTLDPQKHSFIPFGTDPVPTGAEGRYRFEGMGPGVYRLVIRYPLDDARKARCQEKIYTVDRYLLSPIARKVDVPDIHLPYEESYLALLAMNWIDAKVRVQCGQAGLQVRAVEQTTGLDPSVGLTERQAELSKTWSPKEPAKAGSWSSVQTVAGTAPVRSFRTVAQSHVPRVAGKLRNLGTTNEAGELVFEWDRPLPLRIDLYDSSDRLMGTSGQFVSLNPTGETLITIDAVPGTLRISLPTDFELQENQAVQYRLERTPANGVLPRVETIYGDRPRVKKDGMQTGPKHLLFSEMRAGRYTVQASYMFQDADSRWYPLGQTLSSVVEVHAGKPTECLLVGGK